MIQEHVSEGGVDIASPLGAGDEAVLKLRAEAVTGDIGNVMDLCQTSDLVTSQMNLSFASFSIESHRQSLCELIDLHGIEEEATSTQIGGLSDAGITREDEHMSLVDVIPLFTCIDGERDQANAARESDPGEIQEFVVGSEGDCNGLKRFVSIKIVNSSELDVASEELKMGSPVDLDVEVSPTYQEEQENQILEATAPGTSQAGAGEDISIISRKPGGKLCSKISMTKSEVSVVGSQGDCNGSIGIVNPPELDVVSEELKMRSPKNLDVDVLPTYQEEQWNDMLEATFTGTSSQAGAGDDMSVLSREPCGNQEVEIEIQAGRSNVCMDVSRWTQQLGWPHWHPEQVHRLMFHHLGRGFTRHHQVLSVCIPSNVILKPAFLVDGIQTIKKLKKHRNAIDYAVIDGMGQSVLDNQLLKFWSADAGLRLRSCWGHEGDIMDLAVSNRNKFVASASSEFCIESGLLPSGVPVCALQGCQHLHPGSVASRKPLKSGHIMDEHVLAAQFRKLWSLHCSIVTCSRDGMAIDWMLQSLKPNARVGPWRRAYDLCVTDEATLGDESQVADRHCEPRADNTTGPGTYTDSCEKLRLIIVHTKLCSGSSVMKSDILDVGSLLECSGSMRSTPEVSPTEVETCGEEDASTCPEEQEKCILQATCGGTSEARNGEDLVGFPSSEVLKTYVRRRKQSSSTLTATEDPGALEGKAHVSNDKGLPKPRAVGHREAKNEGALSPKDIKCYVRRQQCQTGLHDLADTATQAQPHTPANFTKEKGRGDGSAKKSCMENQASGYKTNVQENNAEESTVEDGFIQSDYQPSWLPEGWALESKVRDGGTAKHKVLKPGGLDKSSQCHCKSCVVCELISYESKKLLGGVIKMQFYHDLKSGQRFRSRNEVMQYLDSVKAMEWEVKPRQWNVKTPIQNKKSADHLASGRPAAVQSPRAKLFPSIQASALNTTGASGTDVSNPHIPWVHVSGPNGPIWLPWGGSIDPGQENQSEVDKQGTVVKAPVREGTSKAPLLSPTQGVQSPTASSIFPVETSSEQKELENKGKLILRLKRKHPNQDAGKGRSKRPMYEVVHGEKTSKASSSTSFLNEKVVPGEGTTQVVSGSLLKQGQGEMQPPVKKSSMTKAATLDLPVEQCMASITKNLFGNPLARSAPLEAVPAEQPPFKKPRVQNNTIADWSGSPNPLQPGPARQEPFMALGIPATASASGLQQMAPFGANHTHVFMHHTKSSIPISWQCECSSQPPAPVATPVPNLGSFSSAFVPLVSGPRASAQVLPQSGTYSSLGSVPVPTFMHFSNSSTHLNTTSSFYPGTGSSIGSRARDAATVAKMVEGPSQPHKTTVHKSLTKTEHSKLLEGLGRRLCQVGLRQQPKILSCPLENMSWGVELPKPQ